MPNKPRPDCPRCVDEERSATAMKPMFVKRPRGDTMKRAGDTFYCDEHGIVAVGREYPVHVDEDELQTIAGGPEMLPEA